MKERRKVKRAPEIFFSFDAYSQNNNPFVWIGAM